eukprot:5824689-Pleurochrysis_carterae.AAC.1
MSWSALACCALQVRRLFLVRGGGGILHPSWGRGRHDLADTHIMIGEAGVLALRARLGVLLASEAKIYNDDGDFLWT